MGSPPGKTSPDASPTTRSSNDNSGDGANGADFDAAVADQRSTPRSSGGRSFDTDTPRSSGGRSFDDPPSSSGGGGGGSWGGEEIPEANQSGAVVAALPLAGTLAVADGPFPFGDALAAGVLAGAGIYAGYQYFTRPDDPVGNGVVQSQATSPGFTGEPGSTETVYNPDGTPKQTRTYGNDGYPETDIDYNHDHGQGQPHVHDWDRPEDGGPPTHKDRQPGRPPREGEVE